MSCYCPCVTTTNGAKGFKQFDPLTVERLRQLLELFDLGEFGSQSHEVHPDLPLESDENYLYFTLSAALNLQRRSEGLWRSALATFSDPATRFVFSPSAVVERPHEARAALIKHRLALQTERHTKIWLTLCDTLHRRYGGRPQALLAAGDFDVSKIISLMVSAKSEFPCISGPKMANYWLYILSRFTDAPIRNKHQISIIPDVHVTRASAHLGLIKDTNGVKPEYVAAIWRAGLEGTGIAPMDLHAPLWRWSRAEFMPAL